MRAASHRSTNRHSKKCKSCCCRTEFNRATRSDRRPKQQVQAPIARRTCADYNTSLIRIGPRQPRMVHGVVRSLLLVFTIFIACPIRYWAINSDVDDTWAYALNYAAAHGLAIGRDVVWTTGPLGYLAFPEDIGNNLAHGLLFQSVVWLVLIAILVDLFFRARFALRNLALFTLFLALSAPLYWFNYMGVENLLLMGVLVLLVIERMRGGWPRYVVALALIGVIAL